MTSAVGVTKVNSVQSRSAAALKAAIAVGPTSVTVEADRSVFQRYTGGILNSAACGTQLDHAITAVGYGTQGVHHGETEDTSTSPLLKEPLVSAVSNKPQSGQTPHDHPSDSKSNNVIIN